MLLFNAVLKNLESILLILQYTEAPGDYQLTVYRDFHIHNENCTSFRAMPPLRISFNRNFQIELFCGIIAINKIPLPRQHVFHY